MRNLDRDRRPVFVASCDGQSPDVDSEGRLTGTWSPSYTEPREYWPTVTIGHGYAWHFPYGLKIDYDRVVRLDDPNWEVNETDVMWIDRIYSEDDPGDALAGDPPTAPHDYIVKKVGRGKGYTILYVERVGASS